MTGESLAPPAAGLEIRITRAPEVGEHEVLVCWVFADARDAARHLSGLAREVTRWENGDTRMASMVPPVGARVRRTRPHPSMCFEGVVMERYCDRPGGRLPGENLWVTVETDELRRTVAFGPELEVIG